MAEGNGYQRSQDDRINGLEDRVTHLENRMDAGFRELRDTMREGFTQIRQDMDGRFGQLHGDMRLEDKTARSKKKEYSIGAVIVIAAVEALTALGGDPALIGLIRDVGATVIGG